MLDTTFGCCRSQGSGCLFSPMGSRVGAGGRAWGGSPAIPTGDLVGIPGGMAHRLWPVQVWARGRGVSVAGRRVWPDTRDSRLEARPAGGTRGPPRQAQPPARGLSPNVDRAQTCRLPFPGGPESGSANGGGAAGPASSEKKAQSAAPAFPPPRVRGFRVAGPSAPPRLARCLFVSPRLPSSQTNGCWQEIGRALGEPRKSTWRGGGAARPAGSGCPRPGRGRRGMF